MGNLRPLATGIAASLLAAALVLACSGDGDDDAAGANAPGADGSAPGPRAAPVAKESFLPALFEAMCSGIAPCCANAGHAFVEGACARATSVADAGVTGNPLLDPLYGATEGLTYDPQAAGDCIASIRQYQASCSTPATTIDEVVGVASKLTGLVRCSQVYAGGTKQPGEACAALYECAQPAGSAATGAFAGCGRQRDADGGERTVCVAYTPRKRGESCTPDPDLETQTRVEPCAIDTTGTGAGALDPSLVNRCDPATRTCVPYTVVPAGAACNAAQGTLCTNVRGCVGGTCLAAVAPGAACTNDDACPETYRCDATSRTCVLRAPIGAPCTENDDCQSDTCNDAQVCASRWSGFAAKNLCEGT